MDTHKDQKDLSKLLILSVFFFVGVLFAPKSIRADFATPFVEINNQVGDVSEAYGYVVALGSNPDESENFLVIVSTDTMGKVLISATADKGVVSESLLGRWVIIKAQVISYHGVPFSDTNLRLKILSVKSVDQRREEFEKEYEEIMAIEEDAQKKLSESKNIKFETGPHPNGIMTAWISLKQLPLHSVVTHINPTRSYKELPSLNVVTYINPMRFNTTDEDLQPLSKLTQVKYIDLNSSKITDKGLSHLAGHTNMETLFIGDTKITDSGLENLKDMIKLRELKLSGTLITDKGVTNLKNLSRLESLDIGRNNLTDDSLAYIKNIVSLRTLNINSTNVTDKGIALLENLKNLQNLDLYNTKTTKEGREQLEKAIFNLKINIEAPPVEH